MSCIFCEIAAGNIPSKKAFEDELVLAFHDIDPKAPVHLVLIPKSHIESASGITPGNSAVVARLFEAAAALGKEYCPGGFRVVTNAGADGGQTVSHLHFHLLGGRQLGWPPG